MTLPKPSPRAGWGAAAAAIVGAAALIEFLQWPILPRSLDIHYHLSAAAAFDRAGGWTARAFWEAAPAGRPHLYPPLFHALLLGFSKAGLGLIGAARLLDAAAFPLWLSAVWIASRKAIGPRAAFFALVFTAAAYPAYLSSFQYPAFTLACAAGLFSVSCLLSERPAAAALWLAAAFYAHTLAGAFVGTAVLLYALFQPSARPGAARALAGGLLGAAPILGWQALHSSFFTSGRVLGDRVFDADFLPLVLAPAGLAVAANRRGKESMAAALAVSAAFFSASYPARFWGGQGLAGFAMLAGLVLGRTLAVIEDRRGKKGALLAAAGFCAAIALASPVLRVDTTKKTARLVFSERTLVRDLDPGSYSDPRRATIYFEKPYAALSERVDALAEPGETVWSNLAHPGALLGALSGRPTVSTPLAEVRPYAKPDPAKARVWAVFKEQDGALPSGAAEAAARLGFSDEGDTPLVRFYRGPSRAKVETPAPAVPEGVLVFSAFALLGAAVLVSRLEKKAPSALK